MELLLIQHDHLVHIVLLFNNSVSYCNRSTCHGFCNELYVCLKNKSCCFDWLVVTL